VTTLLGAVAAIQDVADAMTGIRYAPDYPPDSLNIFPCAICYGARGERQGLGGNGWVEAHDIIFCEIHVPRKDLARDVALLMPFVETFCNDLLEDVTLGGDVTAIEPPITWEVLERTFDAQGAVKTLCLRFTIPVKLVNAIT